MVHYCNALSRVEGLSPYYRIVKETVETVCGDGYRLPTEAEWEYACRAGSKGHYCFGDDEKKLSDYAWYSRYNSVFLVSVTHSVGEKKANDFGLYDIHGNVWEWCWDRFGRYESDSVVDPTGSAQPSDRVSRGGGRGNTASFVRSATRDGSSPVYRQSNLGFRIARDWSN